MSKTCNGCATDEKMSKVIMSSADWQRNEQRHERREKRLVWVIVLLIVLLVGSNIGWLIYESQFEVIESTTNQEVIQEADNGENHFIGGDIIGETDDQNNNDDQKKSEENN